MPATPCPQSGQPELKHAAVRVELAALPWQLAAAAWLPAGEALALRERLRRWGQGLDFFSCVPFGRETDGRLGLSLRAAAAAPQPVQRWLGVAAGLGLDDAATLRYDDPRNGRGRRVRLAGDGTLQGFVLAGDTVAAGWMLEWLQRQRSAAPWGRALLAAGAKPPEAGPARSVQVCACHDVSEDTILQALHRCEGSHEDRLQGLQAQLRCGTSCGSCLPAVKALLRRSPAAVAVQTP